jgi:hypothetical protein
MLVICCAEGGLEEFAKISNGTLHEGLDWGLAHLYCNPEGWKFFDGADSSWQTRTDPTAFLEGELARLKAKFYTLTGMDFDVQSERDMVEHMSKRRSEDVRGQVRLKLSARGPVASAYVGSLSVFTAPQGVDGYPEGDLE